MLAAACGRSDTSVESFGGAEGGGFLFMGVGEETLISPALRKHLGDRLGEGAVEPSAPVDLAVRAPDLLARHLPQVEALQRQLNAARGVRREHDTTRLTYRYPRRQGLPFSYAELIFDNRTRKPLLIRIRASGESQGILATLEEKHGPSRRLDDQGPARLWEHGGNLLLVAPLPNRQGKDEIEILIYFVNGLEALAAAEAQARQAQEEAVRRAGDRAF
jgi:hypothetical protein